MGRSEALIANVSELVEQHPSGLGRAFCLCGCCCVTAVWVSVRKRDVFNEGVAGKHAHTEHPLSVLLSQLILLLAAFCPCLFATGASNRPGCKTCYHPLLPDLASRATLKPHLDVLQHLLLRFTVLYFFHRVAASLWGGRS